MIPQKPSFLKTFLIFCLVAFLLLFANNWLLVTDDIYFDSLGEQLSFERINELIEFNKKWSWVIYPATPLFYLFKVFLVVTCLSIGAFLFRAEISLNSLFKIVLFAEFVFLVPSLIKLIWFGFVNVNYTLGDLQHFSPLSAMSFFERADLQPWLIYPLSLINLFEVAYIATLSYLLGLTLKSDFIQSLKLVLSSYGVGLMIWVVFIMFLSLNLTS